MNDTKLSPAMIKMITAISGSIRISQSDGKNMRTMRALRDRGLVQNAAGSNVRYAVVELTLDGLETVQALTNTQPAIVETPVEETPAEESEDLPAKMPLAPLMDADTAPMMDAPIDPRDAEIARLNAPIVELEAQKNTLPADVNACVNRVYLLSMDTTPSTDFDTRWRIVLENLYMTAVQYRKEEL